MDTFQPIAPSRNARFALSIVRSQLVSGMVQ